MARKRKRRSTPPKQLVSPEATIKQLQSQLVDPEVQRWLWHGAQGVRERILQLNFRTLRNLSQRLPLINAIINTRTDQILPFCKFAVEKGDKGFKFEIENRTEEFRSSEINENEIMQLSTFIEQTGFEFDVEREDDFADYISMLIRDVYEIDQVATEVQRNRAGDVVAFWGLDGSCYSDDTEILTETRGWILFKDLYADDRVATRSKKNVFEWQLPTRYVARPYKGQMVHFNQRSMDVLVHPDHRMLYERKRYDYEHTTIGIKAAKDIVHKGHYYVPMQSVWNGGLDRCNDVFTIGQKVVSIKDWMAFLGIYLSDGCTAGSMGGKNAFTKVVYITVPEGTLYHEDVKDLLENRLPFDFKLQRDGKSWRAVDYGLWTVLHDLGNVYTKYIPVDVKNLSTEYLSILWEWALKGDGSRSATKLGRIERSLTTVSYKLASDYQEIIQKIGLSASITKKKIPNKMPIFKTHTVKSLKQAYIVSELVSKVRALKGKYVDYQGMIYCVTVPNEILYTRRNGYAVWCGNTIFRVADEKRFARGVRYVQMIEDKIYNEYNGDDILFDYRYKRSDIKYRGYGYSPVEQAIDVITTLLFGYNYIRDQLMKDKMPKGFIQVMGDVGKPQLDQIRNYWYAAMAGAGGQWAIPILPSGKDGVGIDFKTLSQSNRDMEYHKTIMFVSTLMAAVFSIDLAEMGIKTDDSTTLIGENMEPRIQHSKDRGLSSMLSFIEQHINKILRKSSAKYRFKFVGLTPEDEQKKSEVRSKQLATHRTIDEIREEDELEPFNEDWSTMPLQPQAVQIYLALKQADAQAAMQEQGGGGEFDYNDNSAGEESESDAGEKKKTSNELFANETRKSLEAFGDYTNNLERKLHIVID